jgi:hypothetical protein
MTSDTRTTVRDVVATARIGLLGALTAAVAAADIIAQHNEVPYRAILDALVALKRDVLVGDGDPERRER